MRTADTSGERTAARRLERHANMLQHRAAVAASSLKPLARAERSQIVRGYDTLLLKAVRAQYEEGRSLQAIARLTVRDPLLDAGSNLRSLSRLQARARRSAEEAVGAASLASRMHHRYRSLFRYTPVGRR